MQVLVLIKYIILVFNLVKLSYAGSCTLKHIFLILKCVNLALKLIKVCYVSFGP
jgi:hypothetical protein